MDGADTDIYKRMERQTLTGKTRHSDQKERVAQVLLKTFEALRVNASIGIGIAPSIHSHAQKSKKGLYSFI